MVMSSFDLTKIIRWMKYIGQNHAMPPRKFTLTPFSPIKIARFKNPQEQILRAHDREIGAGSSAHSAFVESTEISWMGQRFHLDLHKIYL